MQPGHPIRIITISREYGSGGAAIGSLLESALSWRVIDHTLLEEVAKRLGTGEADISGLDEHTAGLLEQLGRAFQHGVPEYSFVGRSPDPDEIAAVEQVIMREAGETPPLIAIGHGGQCVFAHRPDTLHVRIYCPFAVRVKRVAERRQISQELAAAETNRIDADRRRYLQHVCHRAGSDPQLYDLFISTGAMTLDEAAGLILRIVRDRNAEG